LGTPPSDSQTPIEPTPKLTIEEKLANLEVSNKQLLEEKAKLEGDLKSSRGRRAPMDELRAELSSLGTRIDDTGRAINVLSRSVASGDTHNLSSELDQIQQNSAQQRTAEAFSAQFNTLVDDLQKANQDESDQPLVDLEIDPRFQDFRSDWIAARDTYDFVALARAESKAERQLSQIHRESQNEALKVEQSRREVAEGKLKAINPTNMDISAPPASNGIALDNLSPQEKIAQGLRREQDTGQRSTIWSVTAGS
jgi:hypothetical protein